MSETKGPSFFLCGVDELNEGERRKFAVGSSEVLLIKLDGKIFAIEPMCTHDGTDIARGKFDPIPGTLECSKHFAVFDVRTGTPLRGPFGADGDTQPPLRLYEFSIDSGRIMLKAKQEWGIVSEDS